MKKKRFLSSILLIIGFILLILSAIALPSASENARSIVLLFAVVSVGMIITGIIVRIFGRRE
jgi:hypothetical protein